MLGFSDLSVVIETETPDLGRMLRGAMKGAGARDVRIAAGPREALEAFLTEEPEAFVVVVDGPDFNNHGIAMIRFLRTYEKCPNRYVPIVAVSDRRDPKTVRAVINAGGHEYCLLPASGDTLMRKISNAIFVGFPFVEAPGYFGPCRRRKVDPSYQGAERRLHWSPPATNRAAQEAIVDRMLNNGR